MIETKTGRRFSSERPNPIDIHVGSRVRLRRNLLGMSQEKLGEALGLTFQQIQKYERGANRVGASRLFEMSKVLGVTVSFFFEDIPDESIAHAPGLAEGAEPFTDDPMKRRETLELVRAYYRIRDGRVRRRVFDLLKTLSNADSLEPVED